MAATGRDLAESPSAREPSVAPFGVTQSRSGNEGPDRSSRTDQVGWDTTRYSSRSTVRYSIGGRGHAPARHERPPVGDQTEGRARRRTMDASAGATPSGDRFRGQVLLLRGRAGLTQRALAAHLGIS